MDSYIQFQWGFERIHTYIHTYIRIHTNIHTYIRIHTYYIYILHTHICTTYTYTYSAIEGHFPECYAGKREDQTEGAYTVQLGQNRAEQSRTEQRQERGRGRGRQTLLSPPPYIFHEGLEKECDEVIFYLLFFILGARGYIV